MTRAHGGRFGPGLCSGQLLKPSCAGTVLLRAAEHHGCQCYALSLSPTLHLTCLQHHHQHLSPFQLCSLTLCKGSQHRDECSLISCVLATCR